MHIFPQKNKKSAEPVEDSYNRGFTLVEMVVVLSIFAIMAGMVLFNYTAYEANINLENTSQDIALLIQQAENNAVNGAYPTLGSNQTIPDNWRPSYGVFFSTANPKNIVSFFDTESLSPNDPSYATIVLGSNGRGFPDDSNPFGTPNSCGVSTECIDNFTLPPATSISGMCHGDTATPPSTCDDPALTELSLDFTRPFPDRFAIYGATGTGANYSQNEISDDVRIRVTSDADKSARDIVISALGEIHIETVQ